MCARMRKKKNMPARMERVASLRVDDPAEAAGSWRSRFPFDGPLEAEIGCGKGAFILKKALVNPDVCYVAVERVPEALVMAMEKVQAAGVRNVRFICGDAAHIAEWFAPAELNALYVNFCDPWPKKGQRKRRLTHRDFLALYAKVLAPGGELTFKTDNPGLFAFSLEEFSACGLETADLTDDLHATDIPNVTTEYEEKFAAEGIPIHHVRVRFPSLSAKGE